jgi:hypothetical protein
MITRPLIIIASLTLFSSLGFSATKNLCDDLVDSGASAEAVKKCQDKFGISDYSKERSAKEEVKKDTDAKKSEDTVKKKENIEIKKFTTADLNEEGFGKPFYAIRGDYRNHKYKEKRITEGDSLCKYLGYEKALKSVVSPEIMPDAADKKGLVVDTTWLGGVKNEPELYRDEELMFTVRKYVEITCAKRKDKALDGTNEMLKTVTEDLVVLNDLMGGPRADRDQDVDNSGRKVKDGKATFGYKRPDWATETPDPKAKSK